MRVDANKLLFGERVCIKCGRMLAPEEGDDMCRGCRERELFNQVREYIRQNDVTEREVVQKFGISKWKVREWIKDGRIEYVEDNGHQFAHPKLSQDEEYISKVKGFAAMNREDNSKWHSHYGKD